MTMMTLQFHLSTIHTETQFVRVMLSNPLKVPIQLSNITLAWRFQPAGEDDYTINNQVFPQLLALPGEATRC